MAKVFNIGMGQGSLSKGIAYPTLSGTLTYTGSAQGPTWSGYDSSMMELTGVTSATDAGTYTAVFTPIGNYVWADGTQDPYEITWTIERATISSGTPTQSGTLTYTGSSLSPSWSNYDSSQLTLGGTTSGTNAGSYTATFTPTSNYQWSDGTTTSKSVTWTIGKATISTTPSQSGSLTYTGSSQSPSWSNYSSSQLTLGGTTSGTNAGSYTATFTPTSNYQWSDGTTSSKSVTWTIGRATISTTPSQSGSLTYTGKSQSPSWSNYNSSQLTIGGTTSGTNAGSYTATFTPTSNYQWSGGSTSSKSVTWTIDKKEIYWPDQTGTLTYNGSSQSPTWDSYYDSSLMYASGTTSATNAGSYSVTWYLYDTTNYKWKNTTSSGYTVTWTISKATPKLSCTTTSVKFTSWGSYTYGITYNGDGSLSAGANNSVVGAFINSSGNLVIQTQEINGTSTVTINASSGTNYNSASTTVSVTVNVS